MTLFRGTATAIITPFVDDNVDFESLDKLIDYQLNNEVSAIIVNGTTGEPTTMTHKERTAVAKRVIERVNREIPVICGAGSNNTYTAIEYAQEALDIGADGILVVTPYYNKCTQNGLIAHYKAIADKVDLPMVMYNVPGRTGLNMLPSTVAALAGYKNIVAIKEASGNLEQIMEIDRLTNGSIDIYSGEDGLVYPALCCGGKGVISVASNVVPKLMVELCDSFFNNNYLESKAIQYKLQPLIKALFCEVNPIPAKKACQLLGLIKSDYMRLPLTSMEKVDVLVKAMTDLGLKIN